MAAFYRESSGYFKNRPGVTYSNVQYSAMTEIRLAFFGKSGHSFLLIVKSKAGMEKAALEK